MDACKPPCGGWCKSFLPLAIIGKTRAVFKDILRIFTKNAEKISRQPHTKRKTDIAQTSFFVLIKFFLTNAIPKFSFFSFLLWFTRAVFERFLFLRTLRGRKRFYAFRICRLFRRNFRYIPYCFLHGDKSLQNLLFLRPPSVCRGKQILSFR